MHLGSGIFNPLPQVNHPAKVAERVAMLDHISQGRVEFGTGRGAGSHEILGFLPGISSTSGTKEIWEDVIAEFPKMWMQDTYEGYEGKFWSLPPRKVLPKPWKKPHPPMWYACGNISSYEMCANRGLGVLGFSVGDLNDMEPIVKTYKKHIVNAEPIGAFVNDNIMITTAGFVDEDGKKARKSMLDAKLNYLQSQVFRYHDTFPHPEAVPYWPALIPDFDADTAEYMINIGAVICGDPDEALANASAGRHRRGSLVSAPVSRPRATLQMIKLMGKHVSPIDTDQ